MCLSPINALLCLVCSWRCQPPSAVPSSSSSSSSSTPFLLLLLLHPPQQPGKHAGGPAWWRRGRCVPSSHMEASWIAHRSSAEPEVSLQVRRRVSFRLAARYLLVPPSSSPPPPPPPPPAASLSARTPPSPLLPLPSVRTLHVRARLIMGIKPPRPGCKWSIPFIYHFFEKHLAAYRDISKGRCASCFFFSFYFIWGSSQSDQWREATLIACGHIRASQQQRRETRRERERQRERGEKVSHLLVYSNFKCLRLWKCAVSHRCAALISNPGRVIIVRHERSALHHCYEQWSNKQATVSLSVSLCAPRPFIWTQGCVYITSFIRFLFDLHHVVIAVPAQRGVVPGLLSDLRVID